MPAGWVAGAAALGGALISADASQNAADTQAQSAANADAQTMLMYNQNVARLQPFTQAGQASLGNLSSLLGNNGANQASMYQESPGYQWQLGQGTQAITNSAAAMGGVNSGNTLKALQSYGQGLANQDFNQWLGNTYNMNMGMANMGQSSAAGTANLGASAANTMGQNTIGAGNAQAAGQVGAANAYGNALGSIGNLAMYQQMQQGSINPYGDLTSGDYSMMSGAGGGGLTSAGGGFTMNMPSY